MGLTGQGVRLRKKTGDARLDVRRGALQLGERAVKRTAPRKRHGPDEVETRSMFRIMGR